MNTNSIKKKLLRIDAVRERYGDINPSTIYRWVASGHLPQPVQIGPRLTGWWEHELDDHDETLKRGVSSIPIK